VRICTHRVERSQLPDVIARTHSGCVERKRVALSPKTIIACIDQFPRMCEKRERERERERGSALTLIRNDDRETSGDDRRASISKKTRPRRASATAPRRDSVRPTKADIKETPVAKDTREFEQARRHRRIAMIVLGTFIFLLTASVLVVVVTLTHSTFLSPATGSKELTEHRAHLQCKCQSWRSLNTNCELYPP